MPTQVQSRKPTTLSTRRLSDVARHVVQPDGIVTTGWPAVERRLREFGDTFDEWQHGAGKLILGKRADGIYAATVGGVTLSIPRQVAKTFLVSRMVFALCVEFPSLKVLWTAHRTRTSTNTFRGLQAYAKRSAVMPHLAPGRNDGIRTTNGEQEISFRKGSVIMFGARETGFGRGFDEVDIEVFDEAQILTEKALEDMVAATNQSRHPHGALLFYMGTPPRPVDPGEAFAAKRREALSGESADAVYIECSADRDADPDDRAQWAKANASYPHRTPERSMLRLRKNLPSVDSWRREALGIWDDDAAGSLAGWDALADPESRIVSHHAWALAVSPIELGPQWASIGLAGRRADGLLHVEWMEHRPGTGWVVARCKEAFDGKGIPLRVHKSGPEGALIDQLIEAGVKVEQVTSMQVSQATGAFMAAALGSPPSEDVEAVPPTLRHMGQRSLTKAARNAVLRSGVDGAVAWSQRKSSIEITPLQAVTVAAGGVPDVQPVVQPGYYGCNGDDEEAL